MRRRRVYHRRMHVHPGGRAGGRAQVNRTVAAAVAAVDETLERHSTDRTAARRQSRLTSARTTVVVTVLSPSCRSVLSVVVSVDFSTTSRRVSDDTSSFDNNSNLLLHGRD